MSLNPTTKQWLQSVTLRYSEAGTLVQQVESLLIAFRGLSPKTDYYTADDGHRDLLLLVFGVVPISFKGAHYNIPISIWIPLTFPRQGPVVFVTPTPAMYIKPGRFVDISGRVLHPSLSFWNQNTTLLDVCHRLCQEFSLEPPVASKENNSSTNSSPSRPPIAASPSPPLNSLPRPVSASVSPPPIPTKNTYSPNNSIYGSPATSYLAQQQQPLPPPVNSMVAPPPLPRPPNATTPFSTGYQQQAPPPAYNISLYQQQQQYQQPQNQQQQYQQPRPQGQSQGSPSHSSSPSQSPQRPPFYNSNAPSTNSPNRIPPVSGPSNQSSASQTPSGSTGSAKPLVNTAAAAASSSTYSPPPPKPHLPTPTKSTFQPDATLAKMSSLRHKVTLKIKEFLDGLEASCPAEMERLGAINRHLSANEHLISAVSSQCNHVVAMMEKNVELADAKIAELEAFILDLRNRPAFNPDVDMKSPILLEQQLCDVVAEYHVAADTLYYLSKGFGGSSSNTPADVFIKHVRQIAREMFMKKVMASKISGILFAS